MAFAVRLPNLAGALTGTSLALTVAEDALAVGTKRIGALAQVSGAAMGFNIFTPTTDCAYHLVIRGQDVATGSPSNAFLDTIELQAVAGWTHTVLHSTTLVGTPGARTYSNNTGALKVVVGSGTTWYIDVVVLRFPA